MILEIIIYMLVSILNILASFFPGAGQVPLLLPWGMDDAVQQGAAGFHILSTSFPPFQIVLSAFLIYIGFRIALQLLKAVPVLGRTIR